MLRIIYAGNFKHPWHTEAYIADAFEAIGCHVDRLQEDEFTTESVFQRVQSLIAANKNTPHHQPVVFFFAKGCFKNTPFDGGTRDLICLLHHLKQKTNLAAICCWVFDLMAPEFSTQRYVWATHVSGACDIFFTTDGYTVSEHGLPNALVLRQAMPICKEHEGQFRSEYLCQIAHLGSVYGTRFPWRQSLDKHFGSEFRSFEDVHGDDLFDLCKSANIIIGPSYPMHDNYWSNRIYLVAGHGGCFAAPTVAGMREEGWIPGENYFEISPYTHIAIPQLKTLLKDKALQRSIASTARSLIARCHTYRNRATEIVKQVQELISHNQRPTQMVL